MSINFEKELLREKKARFIAAVKRTVRYLRVPEPRVEFHDCPDAEGNELAHIHAHELLICVLEI